MNVPACVPNFIVLDDIRNQNDEFIATEAPDKSNSFKRGFYFVRDNRDDQVTDTVPESVVYILKIVTVNQQERKRMRILKHTARHVFNGESLVHARECVKFWFNFSNQVCIHTLIV